MDGAKMFPDLRAFYSRDARRRSSGEADYGVHWRLNGWPAPWRVSYVQDTGEVYAVYLGLLQPERMIVSHGPVLALGTVEPDHREPGRRDPYYRTLDAVLAGWPAHCGEPDGLLWVRDRLAAAARTIAAMGGE